MHRVVLGYDIVCNSVTLFVVDQNLSVAQWKAQSNPNSIPDKYLVTHCVGNVYLNVTSLKVDFSNAQYLMS